MTLERSKLWPEQYEYLSREHSHIYKQALDGDIPLQAANTIIVLLLEHIAAASRAAHVASKY